VHLPAHYQLTNNEEGWYLNASFGSVDDLAINQHFDIVNKENNVYIRKNHYSCTFLNLEIEHFSLMLCI
jgi:hypothetical protein